MTTSFFGPPVELARYDKQVHPIFEKLTLQQLGYRWRETEVDVTRDKSDYRSLAAHEQHIFDSNIKRQILLDTKQGKAPAAIFGAIASLPEVENWLVEWTESETIHSRSYMHILRGVYSNPSEVFDSILTIPEIAATSASIDKYYDNLELWNAQRLLKQAGLWKSYSQIEHKKALWLALMAVNALEGIRFYGSFACSWAFYEQKRVMEGNAKLIKLICRDENLHLAAVQHMLKILPKEDPDFATIAEQTKDQCVQIFEDCVAQEEDWGKYLFQHGSMIGMNYDMYVTFIKERAAKLMRQAKLPTQYETGDSLPWTKKYISGADVQVAPQETELTSYVDGGINQDMDEKSFSTTPLKRKR